MEKTQSIENCPAIMDGEFDSTLDVTAFPLTPEKAVVSRDDAHKEKKKQAKRRILIVTIFHGLVAVFLGMQIAQKGPSFLDLQMISGTDVEGASTYFTASSFGYMVGSLVAGFLYDKLSNTTVLICGPLVVASIIIASIPHCTSYVSMLLMHLAGAFMCGLPETTLTAEQLYMWQGKSDSAVHFLSFAYSLGGVLSPLYTEPFLAPIQNVTQASPLVGTNITRDVSYYNHSNTSVNSSDQSPHFQGQTSNEHLQFDIIYAYLITGIVGIIVVIPLFVICIRSCFQRMAVKKTSHEEMNPQHKRLPSKMYVILTLVSCSFLFVFTFLEDSFNLFLPMFVVSELHWSKEDGALLSSLYWGIGTLCKLFVIFLSRRIRSHYILLFSALGMFLSQIAFLIACHFHIDILIWISTSFFGLSQASIFGGAFAWSDTYLIKMDGKVTSATMIFASLGAMVGPFVLGSSMEKISFMVFPYITTCLSITNFLLFVFMLFFLRPWVTRRYGPPRCTQETRVECEDGEEEEEMVTQSDSPIQPEDDENEKVERLYPTDINA